MISSSITCLRALWCQTTLKQYAQPYGKEGEFNPDAQLQKTKAGLKANCPRASSTGRMLGPERELNLGINREIVQATSVDTSSPHLPPPTPSKSVVCTVSCCMPQVFGQEDGQGNVSLNCRTRAASPACRRRGEKKGNKERGYEIQRKPQPLKVLKTPRSQIPITDCCKSGCTPLK